MNNQADPVTTYEVAETIALCFAKAYAVKVRKAFPQAAELELFAKLVDAGYPGDVSGRALNETALEG